MFIFAIAYFAVTYYIQKFIDKTCVFVFKWYIKVYKLL